MTNLQQQLWKRKAIQKKKEEERKIKELRPEIDKLLALRREKAKPSIDPSELPF